MLVAIMPKGAQARVVGSGSDAGAVEDVVRPRLKMLLGVGLCILFMVL